MKTSDKIALIAVLLTGMGLLGSGFTFLVSNYKSDANTSPRRKSADNQPPKTVEPQQEPSTDRSGVTCRFIVFEGFPGYPNGFKITAKVDGFPLERHSSQDADKFVAVLRDTEYFAAETVYASVQVNDVFHAPFEPVVRFWSGTVPLARARYWLTTPTPSDHHNDSRDIQYHLEVTSISRSEVNRFVARNHISGTLQSWCDSAAAPVTWHLNPAE